MIVIIESSFERGYLIVVIYTMGTTHMSNILKMSPIVLLVVVVVSIKFVGFQSIVNLVR